MAADPPIYRPSQQTQFTFAQRLSRYQWAYQDDWQNRWVIDLDVDPAVFPAEKVQKLVKIICWAEPYDPANQPADDADFAGANIAPLESGVAALAGPPTLISYIRLDQLAQPENPYLIQFQIDPPIGQDETHVHNLMGLRSRSTITTRTRCNQGGTGNVRVILAASEGSKTGEGADVALSAGHTPPGEPQLSVTGLEANNQYIVTGSVTIL